MWQWMLYIEKWNYAKDCYSWLLRLHSKAKPGILISQKIFYLNHVSNVYWYIAVVIVAWTDNVLHLEETSIYFKAKTNYLIILVGWQSIFLEVVHELSLTSVRNWAKTVIISMLRRTKPPPTYQMFPWGSLVPEAPVNKSRRPLTIHTGLRVGCGNFLIRCTNQRD